MVKFRRLPLEVKWLLADYVSNRFTVKKALSFPLPESEEKAFRVWDLFFDKFDWLDKAVAAGCAVDLVGYGVHRLLRGEIEPWEEMHLALVCVGFGRYSELKENLRDHKLHEHGRSPSEDFAFERHNITLNLSSVYLSAPRANGIYTKWPNRLSVATRDGRESAYLRYGEREVKKLAVVGLGKNPRPEEATTRICRLASADNKHLNGLVFCRDPIYLFKIGDASTGHAYQEKYDEDREYVVTTQLAEPRQTECPACEMKGQFSFDSPL